MIIFRYQPYPWGSKVRYHRGRFDGGSFYISACGEKFDLRRVDVVAQHAKLRIRQMCGNCWSVRNIMVGADANSRVIGDD